MAPNMRVIVFASQKGGSGKTTLSGHVAVEAHRQGAGPVALVDTDPQGSLAKWWNVRRDPEPAFIQSVFSNLFYDLEQARNQGFRLVVIDTPPAVTRAISEVVSFADLVVLPTRPSPHDMRAVGPTVDLVEARGKQMVFVVNAAAKKARITSEAAIALSQHGTVAPTIVHQRVDFAASMIDGRTVMEIDPTGNSALEITQLWKYLEDKIARIDVQSQPSPRDEPAGASFGRRSFGRRAAQ